MFNEKKLEDMIFQKLIDEDYNFFINRGLRIIPRDKWYRQVNLGSYGIADIIGFSLFGDYKVKYLQVTTIELKACGFEYKNIAQAKRYTTAIFEYAKTVGVDESCINFRNIIITNSSNVKNEESYFFNFHNDIYLDLYSYDFCIENGMSFTNLTSDLVSWRRSRAKFEETALPLISKDLIQSYRANRIHEIKTKKTKEENELLGIIENDEPF